MRELIGKFIFLAFMTVCVFYTCFAFWIMSGVLELEKSSKKQNSIRIEKIKQTQIDSDAVFLKVH